MIRGLLALLLERGVVLGLGLLSNLLIARSLAVDEYGLVQNGLSIVFLLGAFFLIAPAQVVQRQFVLNRMRISHIRDAAFILRMSIALILMAAVGLAVVLKLLAPVFFLLAFIVFNEPLSIGFLEAYHKNEPFRVAVSRGISSLARFSWLTICWIFNLSIYWVCFAWVVEMLFLAISGLGFRYIFDFDYRKFLTSSKNKRLMRLIVSRSFYILPYLVLGTLVGRMDRLLLPYYFDSTQFGYYAVSASMIDQMSVALTMLIQMAVPLIYGRGRGAHSSSWPVIFLYSMLFFFFSLVFVYFLGSYLGWLVGILLGHRYSVAVPYFVNMLYYVPVFGVDALLTTRLVQAASHINLFLKSLISCFCALISIVFFHDLLGVYSALIGLAFSYFGFWSAFAIWGVYARRYSNI